MPWLQNLSEKGKSWTDDDLKQAREAVGNHSMSIRAAASFYNIPKRTLYDHHAGKSTNSKPGNVGKCVNNSILQQFFVKRSTRL